jgi:enoyl-CoA hydratase/carnithine racemase
MSGADRGRAFTLTVEDGIATILLDRPERMNALTRADALELVAAFDQTDADDAVRAVVISGTGRAFCAGADLSAGGFGEAEAPAGEGPPRDWGGILTMRIFDSVKPVIAAINGVAVGVGATMLLPMDVRIAADTARFGFVFTRRGIVPESASSWFLPRLVGISQALRWCYSGEVFGAQEALAGGLVSELVPPDELMATARRIALKLTDGTAPVSVALTRRMLWRMLATNEPMTAHLMESALIPSRGASADAREGVAAFLEKRPPDFPDKVSAGLPEV